MIIMFFINIGSNLKGGGGLNLAQFPCLYYIVASPPPRSDAYLFNGDSVFSCVSSLAYKIYIMKFSKADFGGDYEQNF